VFERLHTSQESLFDAFRNGTDVLLVFSPQKIDRPRRNGKKRNLQQIAANTLEKSYPGFEHGASG